jgi:hypothetical protein
MTTGRDYLANMTDSHDAKDSQPILRGLAHHNGHHGVAKQQQQPTVVMKLVVHCER